MNKEWSFKNKELQRYFKKEDTFQEGITMLLSLRHDLQAYAKEIFSHLQEEEFSKMPLKTDKTLAYYLWHMTRIEDITSNTLIFHQEEVFFQNGYVSRITSPIITTGNELLREELQEFSRKLNIHELAKYVDEVYQQTNQNLLNLTYPDLRKKVNNREELEEKHCVSTSDNAVWLIDYWCNKTYLGLIEMPLSRHLIMHLEGCSRIIKVLKK